MTRRRAVEVVVLLAVCAALSLHLGGRRGGVTVCRLAPGMAREEVLRILGPPQGRGPLEVGTPAAMGEWMEWGSGRLTWGGRPTASFTPDGRVLAVAGDSVEQGGRVVAGLGSAPAEFAGLPARSRDASQPDHLLLDFPEGRLVVSFQAGRASRLVYTSVR